MAYFLDTPSQAALDSLEHISTKYGYKIVAFPYLHKAYEQFKDIIYYPVGPQEFVSLIRRAQCVLTDSFHGTVFSINLQIPFWTFERNYASGKGQSDRITSILNKMGLQNHYITCSDTKTYLISIDKRAMQKAKQWIINQRTLSREFLQNAFLQTGGKHDK